MYDDSAVILPGRGAVYIGDLGIADPQASDIQTWLEAGRMTDLAPGWDTLGHTSLEELPSIGSESEGGEMKGSWENPSLRATAVTTTESLVVQPIQWDLTVAKRRFGALTEINPDGSIEMPNSYTACEDSIIVIFVDGDKWVAIRYEKGSSAPEGDISADSENFLTAPIRYTILSHEGKKGRILGSHLTAPGNDDTEDED